MAIIQAIDFTFGLSLTLLGIIGLNARRTLVEEAVRAGITQTVVDEPVTVIVSEKGWVRCRSGHGVDLANVAFKDGDRLGSAFECRSVDSLVVLPTAAGP